MTNSRVYATCDIGEDALKRVREHGYELEVHSEFEPPPKENILHRIQYGIVGLITTLRDEIDAEIFEAGEGTLRVISQDAVGFDNIDREAANRHRIPFTNTAEVLTHATAEFAFFILGSIARRLYTSERIVRDRQWKTWHPYLPVLGDEVTGKTIGVVGTGRIGQAFALKCTGLDVDLICCDTKEDSDFLRDVQALMDLKQERGLSRRPCTIRYASLQETVETADFLSLHVPLTRETRGMIGLEIFSSMKENAFLINTSRGQVVDEEALYQALTEERIAGAALDVFQIEPLPEDSPLRDPALQDRLRLFHHFASGTRETRLSPDPAVGMAGRCVQGLLDVLDGNYGGDPTRMPYVVNKEAFGG